MAEDLTRPYVGYRSAGRRPESQQDRRAAADAPLAALRGMVSGVLGAPGDVESLVRMLPGLSEQTLLPTSEDVERRLPLRSVSETPAGRAFTTAGQLGGGGYMGPGSPLRAIAALPSAVRRAAQDFAVAAGQPAVNVIKPKGGNWLQGSIEREIEPMRTVDPAMMDVLRNADPRLVDQTALNRVNAEALALDKWLDKKLRTYIRNEMATPEDPIRALAERGITHAEMRPLADYNLDNIEGVRMDAGFPAQGLAATRLGREWEAAADRAIYPSQARHLALTKEVETNPFLLKVPPETMVYEVGPRQSQFERLGFSHLVDELRSAINPESGLPRELLWKYSDLDKVTVPQAVERVAKINEWRAAQKAEADLARANNAAAQVFKEYPEQGFRWVELKKPEPSMEGLKSEYLPEVDMWRIVDKDGGVVSSGATEREALGLLKRKERESSLEDALKYEGETMGHCVGGYCPDVLEGRSRIFSLRDKKGQPHVTIETRPYGDLRNFDPNDRTGGYFPQDRIEALSDDLEALVESLPEKQANKLLKLMDSGDVNSVPNYLKKNHPDLYKKHFEIGENPTQEIYQIKGKANRAPKEEYLPFVQDFVRSQKWGRVGDLENAGLRATVDIFNPNEISKIKSTGLELPEYLTPSQIEDIDSRVWGEAYKKQGFAAGGLVGLRQRYAAGGAVAQPAQIAAVPYDEAKIDALATALTA